MEIQEREVIGEKEVAGLERLRRQVYGDDPRAPVVFEGALKKDLGREEFQGRQRLFLAIREGELVAAVVARYPAGLTLEEASVGTVGFFEGLEDEEAVGAVLREAVAWLREQGAQVVVGPMNGDTWHEYRFNLGPFEAPPFLKEPYNREYYPRLWEQSGFELLMGYHTRRVEGREALEELRSYHRPRWEEVKAAGYKVEAMVHRPMQEVLERVYRMSREVFTDAFLYRPIDEASFVKLYEGAEVLLEEKLSFLLIGPKGEDAGFAFVFPDYARAVAAMRGKKNLLAKLRFWLNRERQTANIKTVGVMPAHRGKGLSSAMAYLYLDGIIESGFEAANMCLISDGNISARADTGVGEVLRRYGLYRWRES